MRHLTTMPAYYNEFDPYAADWLRSLIRNKQLPEGDVDERSILEVQPDDLRGYHQSHFFAGIGGWPLALRLAGWPDDRPVWTGSPPCQPFSSAGKRKGKEDERHLWPEFFRLIRECRPPVVFGEQVASKDGLAWVNDVQDDVEKAGYAFSAQDICAAGVGAPHIRQRLWIVAYRVASGVAEPKDYRNCGNPGEILREDAEQQTQEESRENPTGERGNSSASDGVADSEGERREYRKERAGRDEPEYNVADGRMARAHGQGLQGRGELGEQQVSERRNGKEGRAAEGSVVDGMAEPDRTRLSARCETTAPAGYRDSAGSESSDAGTGPASPTNGFWANPDWLFCRDGKWRPAQPGIKPLVDGLPARMGCLCPGEAPSRQGMLKGYGNAIVPHVAKEVIEAFLDYEHYQRIIS